MVPRHTYVTCTYTHIHAHSAHTYGHYLFEADPLMNQTKQTIYFSPDTKIPDANGSGASIYSDLYLIDDYQYPYDSVTDNYDTFDNLDPELPSNAPAAFRAYAYIDPELTSKASSAFRAYAYTLEKPYDMDYGDKFFV